MNNRGFIYARPSVTTWQYGGISGIHKVVLQENRQWTPFLPVFETQALKHGDAMDCVTRSFENGGEVFLKRTTGREYNFSDRYLAIKSGTTAKGNTFENVAQAARKFGLALEETMPSTGIVSRETYYTDVPKEAEESAKAFKEIFELNYEFIPDDAYTIWEALKYAPIQIGIYAYGLYKNGIYQASSRTPNHGVLCVGGEYEKYLLIFDSYEDSSETHIGQVKKIAWNTPIWGALMPYITLKNPNMSYPFIENKVYILTEAPGGSFFFAGKKLMKVDEPNGQMINILARTGNLKAQTIVKKDLEGTQIYNFKGEKI